MGVGLWVEGLGFRLQGFGSRVWGLGSTSGVTRGPPQVDHSYSQSPYAPLSSSLRGLHWSFPSFQSHSVQPSLCPRPPGSRRSPE